jgi:arylsulfatase A-like enzyme
VISSDSLLFYTTLVHDTDPPYVAPLLYASHYLKNLDNIFVPPNLFDRIENEFYASQQQRDQKTMNFTAKNVQEWAAIYYAMIEQVDTWVGYLLNELDAQGQANNTLIVFTSDHGEFLGAHGMRGKLGFFEEALRVPLFMRLPSVIADGTIVERPVSHLDVFATIMDYLGLTAWDNSDGKSLRAIIDGTDFHQNDGAGVVVSEDDTPDVMNKNVGGFPNLMVRHGPWKLILPKLATSKTQDIGGVSIFVSARQKARFDATSA